MSLLADYERDIEQYQLSYVRAAKALRAIEAGDLWRDGYYGFLDYCERRWGFRKSRVNQLLNAGRMVEALEDEGLEPPPTERALRPLLQVKAWRQENGSAVFDETASWQKRVEAWQICRDQADGEAITSDFVSSVVDQRYKGQKKPSQEKLDRKEREKIWRAICVIADTRLTPAELIGTAAYADLGPSGLIAFQFLSDLRDLITR